MAKDFDLSITRKEKRTSSNMFGREPIGVALIPSVWYMGGDGSELAVANGIAGI